MTARIVILILALALGWNLGHAWGAFTVFLILGAIYGKLGAPKPAGGSQSGQGEYEPPVLPDDVSAVPAKRGKRIDPTRPGEGYMARKETLGRRH